MPDTTKCSILAVSLSEMFIVLLLLLFCPRNLKLIEDRYSILFFPVYPHHDKHSVLWIHVRYKCCSKEKEGDRRRKREEGEKEVKKGRGQERGWVVKPAHIYNRGSNRKCKLI